MEQSGFLRFEDQDVGSRTEGSLDLTGPTVVLKVGGHTVAESPATAVAFTALGDGSHRVAMGGEGIIFEPDDPEAFNKGVAAIEFSKRLNRTDSRVSPPTAPPAPPVPMAVQAPRELTPTGPAPLPASVNPPKSPGVAAVLSFFWPGLGQIYNGHALRAVLFIVGQVVNVFLTLILVGYLTGFIVWIWAMVDAYQGAQAYNLRRVVYPSS